MKNLMEPSYLIVIALIHKLSLIPKGNTFGVEFNRRGEQLGITISGLYVAVDFKFQVFISHIRLTNRCFKENI